MVQVIDNGLQVHLQNGLVHLLFQQFRDSLKAEAARTLQQHHLIVQLSEHAALQELIHMIEEIFLLHTDDIGLRHNLGAYADELADATLLTETRHLPVERCRSLAALQDIAQDESL